MTEETVFFDTYAFFELIEGNPNYKKYETLGVVTTVFNLLELNFIMKREKGKDTADKYLDKYSNLEVPVTKEDVKEATDLRLKKKGMSFPDVIGYAVAKRLGIKFVTG